MAGFEDRMTRGKVPAQREYVLLSGELLVHFESDVSEDAVADAVDNVDHSVSDRVSGTPIGIRVSEYSWPPERSSDAARLRSANVRRITVSTTDDPAPAMTTDLLALVAGALPTLIAGLRIATPIYIRDEQQRTAITPVLDRFVVRLSDSAPGSAMDALVADFGFEVDTQLSDLLGPYRLLRFPAARFDPMAALGALENVRNRPGVVSADFDWLPLSPLSQPTVPNDFYWHQQWGMHAIDLLGGWDAAPSQREFWVAVVDDSFDIGHPELRFTPPDTHLPFDQLPNPKDRGHGTWMSGVIAAMTNNFGIAGMTRRSRILPITLGALFQDSYVAAAINWAAGFDLVKVINLSLQVPDPSSWGDLSAAEWAIANAWDRGIVICGAAGNDGVPSVDYPAIDQHVIAVGAVNRQLRRRRPDPANCELSSSNYGPDLDVVAPGLEIWTTDERGAGGGNPSGVVALTCRDEFGHVIATLPPGSAGDPAGDYFARATATSIATAHVSGLAALLFESFPLLSNRQVREAIEHTCRKLLAGTFQQVPGKGNDSWDFELGYGLIDCRAAMVHARSLRPERIGPGIHVEPPGDGGSSWDTPSCHVFEGYPGNSVWADWLRLYCSLDLRIWIEVLRADVLHAQRLEHACGDIGIPKTRIVVRPGAPVIISRR